MQQNYFSVQEKFLISQILSSRVRPYHTYYPEYPTLVSGHFNLFYKLTGQYV